MPWRQRYLVLSIGYGKPFNGKAQRAIVHAASFFTTTIMPAIVLTTNVQVRALPSRPWVVHNHTFLRSQVSDVKGFSLEFSKVGSSIRGHHNLWDSSRSNNIWLLVFGKTVRQTRKLHLYLLWLQGTPHVLGYIWPGVPPRHRASCPTVLPHDMAIH